jgi:hypothetical protein
MYIHIKTYFIVVLRGSKTSRADFRNWVSYLDQFD